MSLASLRIAADESTAQAPLHYPDGNDEGAVDLRKRRSGYVTLGIGNGP
jgi:hypothetical protein